MRFISWLIGVVLFLLVIAVGAAFIMYPRLPSYLSKTLSEKFQVPVKIESIDLSWNKFVIKDIDISNPKESKLPTALKVQTTTMKAPPLNYLKENIIIDEIRLDNIYASIEFYNSKNTEGNWTVLIDNLDQNNSFGASERGESSKDNEGRTVLIKKLIMTNITIDLIRYGKNPTRLSPIRRIELDNISSEKGFPTEEITEIIIQKMMEQIFSIQGLSNMFQSIIETPARTAGDILKGIFGG